MSGTSVQCRYPVPVTGAGAQYQYLVSVPSTSAGVQCRYPVPVTGASAWYQYLVLFPSA